MADNNEEQRQEQFRLAQSVGEGDDEYGHYKIIPLSMLRGGKLVPTKVYTEPVKHVITTSAPSPRGWYKDKTYDPPTKRPRPCLLPGTLVDTPWGQRAIEMLQKGDVVFGYDEDTGHVAQTYIQATSDRMVGNYIEVVLDNNQMLRLTPEHLVMVKEHGWVEARELTSGDDIVDIGMRYSVGRTITMCGVYGLVNENDGKIYIGSAKNVVDRSKRHLRKLKYGGHSNPHLQAAYDRGDEFHVVVLELCNEDMLIECEQHYMDMYDSMNNESGYNMTIAGRTVPSVDGRRRISAARKGKTWEEVYGVEKAAALRREFSIANSGEGNPNYGNVGPLNSRYGKTNVELFGEEEAARLAAISSCTHKGKKLSNEVKAKVSKARRGKPLSLEHRRAIGRGLKDSGYEYPPMSDEQKEKISQTLKRRYENGELSHVIDALKSRGYDWSYCKRCGEQFDYLTADKRYCDDCRLIVRQEIAARSNVKRRMKLLVESSCEGMQ